MIISNLTGATIQYYVENQSKTIKDGGLLNTGAYVEFQPRGTGLFTVGWGQSISLVNVPSPAIVTFWNGGSGFSE